MNHNEDRLSELTSIGAGHAANAMSVLLDRTLLMAPPRCRKIKTGEGFSNLFPPEDRVVAIFSEPPRLTYASNARPVESAGKVE